jgi:hypothetical protein
MKEVIGLNNLRLIDQQASFFYVPNSPGKSILQGKFIVLGASLK